jgi:8-amino-7-oxononanoate synthase
MPSLEQISDKYLANLRENNLLRELKVTEKTDAVYVTRNGKKHISFCCNDYLGLSQHPKVKQAAIDATQKYGVGSGASRFITGNSPLYDELEMRLARLKGTEDAIVFGSGYLANIGTIPALVGAGDLIIADKLIHACLLDGAILSGAKLLRFAHNNMQKCEELLQKNRSQYKNCLILTDTVFSMDGDRAPIGDLLGLAQKYDAWVMSDDAHGLGVVNEDKASSFSSFLGKDLRESGAYKKEVHEHFEQIIDDKMDKNTTPYIQMGTLSKAVGCYGGYICASKKITDYLRNKARSLIYSTALPPAVLAAAIAALDIIENDAQITRKPFDNAQYFISLIESGIKNQESRKKILDSSSSIVSLILGDEEKAINASKMLENEGFLVSAIRPPTVPKGTARLRFTFSSLHKAEDIEKLTKVMCDKGLI